MRRHPGEDLTDRVESHRCYRSACLAEVEPKNLLVISNRAYEPSVHSSITNHRFQKGNADEDVLPTTDHSENTWLSQEEAAITMLQPLRMTSNEADSFFDFGVEIESPGSPVDECEYTRLIETTSVTPAEVAPESGYVCSSPCSTTTRATSHENSSSSQASSDCQFYDPDMSDSDAQKSSVGCTTYYDCTTSDHYTTSSSSPRIAATSRSQYKKSTSAKSATVPETADTSTARSQSQNGHLPSGIPIVTADSDSCSESLPPSQSTDTHDSTFTGLSSNNSNSTLQDVTMDGEEVVTVVRTSTNSKVEVPNGDCSEQPQDETDDGKVLSNGSAIMPKEMQVATIDLSQTCQIDLMKLINGEAEDEPEDEEQHLSPRVEMAEVEKMLQDCSVVEEEEEVEEKENRREGVSSGDDEDEYFSRPQRVRRCSSLKTGKTPPGTPGRKKIVRFADVLGLDLADVKTFVDEVPKVPKSAYEDLEFTLEPPVQQISLGPRADRVLVPLFQQPGALPCFMDLVREKQVNLENAAVTDPITLTITGTVRVRNLDFHKSVYVRYTIDNWRSFADLQASYVPNSCDGFSDKFAFTIYGHSVQIGQRIEMAVRFHCRGQQFWDSNYNTNYVFQCLPISQPNHIGNTAVKPANLESMISPEDIWCKNFY
ncbi:glycogen-binding subunit 76A isoform X2 [Topomyia yanbarensis]|uniref:glycogen-binding subunit 76A isoform X2 n=1 Tax=Topomyia yanbarensis TaxID=2498891 RepID=UPI00273C24F7|nr:glycogen-binding subunit 76A isoform X2 [Topomyia yanbarensis]XP_058837641.1 glycogen-binding subunit 76A isoform X2 [Topomyia yanbarensis]XP_058837642.1 glycogen-binding subunit 76A isoform X2 [Topomyia yanbarensis]